MTLTQKIKLVIKIITFIPVVIEGIKAIVQKYKELNLEDLAS